MKKTSALSLAALGTVTAAFLTFSWHATRPAAPSQGQSACRCDSATAAIVAHAQPDTHRATIRKAVPGARIAPRFQPDERRLSRAALAQVLPGVTAPIADWRTFAPAELTVVPLPGLPLGFTAKSVTTDGKRTTWIGTNATQGATLVACATETLWDAIITVPGAEEYSVQITPDHVRVFERRHSEAICGQIGGLAQALVSAAAPTAAAISAATVANTADVLFIYDSGTKADWGSAAEMENRIVAVVTTMNTYLEQSRVDNLRWNLVGTVEAPAYPTTGNLEDDLKRMDDSGTELGRFVAQQRALFGADQVQLIVSGTRDYAGIAYTPGHLSVVHHPGTAATAAHELGHNFGCHHDRQEEEVGDNDGKYYYGHRFTHNTRDTGTIMSYASSLVPYFSNPDVSYEGVPLGIAAGQPRAADNARYLRERAASIANLVPTKSVSTPAITAQPTSVTVTAGHSFTLGVTATGNYLSYQWSRNGVDILGAVSSSYAKTASTASDAGTYTVLVSNTAGSVRSDAATVTVNAAPTPPTTPTTPSSSGGGGGGGAFGLLGAVAVLALLASGRLRRSS